ncbi:hypothetical protein FLI85_33845 [Pseudomonas aeruginosa]|nr:hypothetical protein [Pseudomonas aeruginosa]TQF94514.1 hypothetical protein FLM99_20435 [Pseudomonas aeruginosa]TQH26258.1 hypothetical protein FLI64_22805 [Pseudomonas aeruginosa]TQH36339.1 hypothetical protein FLI58_32870 [Pseudomonas aeruginosa]TQH53117.1 hypothetical protein FLI60_13730 [Pseudomonas aeruginosa]
MFVANQQGRVKSQRKLRHDRAPVARAELPGTGPSTAQRSSQGADSRPRRKCAKRMQPLTARTP